MQLNYFNRPYFENGAINKISEVLKTLGIKNPLICSDPGPDTYTHLTMPTNRDSFMKKLRLIQQKKL